MRVITQAVAYPAGLEIRVGPHGFIHNWIYVGIPGVNERVHHPHLGPGTITRTDASTVHVQFDHTGHHTAFPVDRNPATARHLEHLPDDDIYRLMMSRGEGEHYDRAVNELDRRDRDAHEAKIRALYAEHPATDEDRQRVYQGLTGLGENPEDAWAHAHAREHLPGGHAESLSQARKKAVITQLREQGYSGAGFDELARKAWKDDVHRRALHAENETNGYLTTHEGTRKKIDGWALFTGPESAARRYASPELKEYWDQHGRPTFDGFKDELLNGQGRKRIGEDFLR